MNKGKLFKVIAATSAILLGAAAVPVLAGEGDSMGYGSQPTPRTMPEAPKTKSKPSNTSNTVRPELAKQINDAIALGKNKKFQDALAKIKEADASVSDKTPYEEYIITKLMGQFAGELQDNTTSAMAFNRALATNAMPDAERPQMLEVVLALNINTKDYAKAMSAGEELQQLGKLNVDDTGNLALVYYLKGDFPNALKTAKAALAMQSMNGGQPKDQTLRILMNAQIKSNDQVGAKQTLATICALPTPHTDLKCPLTK